MEMWQHNSPSVLLFSQAIYGVGTIVGPLVVRDYLTGEYEYRDTQNWGLNQTDANNYIMNEEELAQSIARKLKIPFLIDGCIVLIGKNDCLRY